MIGQISGDGTSASVKCGKSVAKALFKSNRSPFRKIPSGIDNERSEEKTPAATAA